MRCACCGDTAWSWLRKHHGETLCFECYVELTDGYVAARYLRPIHFSPANCHTVLDDDGGPGWHNMIRLLEDGPRD